MEEYEDSELYWSTGTESEAWRWLCDNRKLGLGDLIRERRWEDAILFHNFIVCLYNAQLEHENSLQLILSSSPDPGAGLVEEIIEASLHQQLSVYNRIYSDEFYDMPIERCSNPLRAAASVIRVARCQTAYGILPQFHVMDAREAWQLLQSMLIRICWFPIRDIRNFARRIQRPSVEALLLCAANFNGRIRRSVVPIIVTILYVTLKECVKESEEAAWLYIQSIISPMTIALREQLRAQIYLYRKLGHFAVFTPDPKDCRLSDRCLKLCSDLLSDPPKFLWSEMYKCLLEDENARGKRRGRRSRVILDLPSYLRRHEMPRNSRVNDVNLMISPRN